MSGKIITAFTSLGIMLGTAGTVLAQDLPIPMPKSNAMPIPNLPLVLEKAPALFADPQSLIGTGQDLALPLALQSAPILDTLANDPLSMQDYFQSGGTLIAPSLVVIPSVPLLNQPLF